MSDDPRHEPDPRASTEEQHGAGALRLRADRPQVMRLSRKILMAFGAVACVGVGGALVYALQSRDSGEAPAELYSTENRTTADGLQGLPRDYSGIPQLGPPLPGDLGRPILGAQNRGQPVPAPEPAIDAAEQRRQQEMEAARVSRLFASTETRSRDLGPASMADAGASLELGLSTAAGRQAAFLNGPVDRRTVSPSESRRRPRPMCCKPVRSSRPRSSPAFAPTCRGRSPPR